MQLLINRITDVSNRCGLDLNIKNTKFITVSEHPILNAQLIINQQETERVEHYTCLGTNLNRQKDHSTEIKQRIIKAKTAFVRIRPMFMSRNVSLRTKCLLKCYIFTVLFYCMEVWSLWHLWISSSNLKCGVIGAFKVYPGLTKLPIWRSCFEWKKTKIMMTKTHNEKQETLWSSLTHSPKEDKYQKRTRMKAYFLAAKFIEMV